MSYLSILILAIVLSIDACIVSFSYGLIFTKHKLKNALLIASFTGFFQAIMPIAGYYLANTIKAYIEPYSKLIILIIFAYLGIKIIKESFEPNKIKNECFDIKCLFLIGIATSIDAFSAGITLLLSGNTILKPALIIGIITFMNSSFGFFIGKKFKNIPTQILEIMAGIVLILLGFKSYFFN